MKVMKHLKSLKFWSKKKKKKRITTIHHHSPPPCCCSPAFQPSAPPLPSWLDYEQQTYTQHLLTADVKFSVLPKEHDISNVNPSSSSGDVETGCSYQQYMVKNPVYGVPVLQSTETERSAGALGCVFNIGAHLFRCFFPCFRIRDVQHNFHFKSFTN
ncbi:hypothetical protein HanPI659440_Chr03g0106851 [Helianthus annuus]|nr:hypothetical protein HanPI659440_Chr03g0106851 [Helianthus annuus]